MTPIYSANCSGQFRLCEYIRIFIHNSYNVKTIWIFKCVWTVIQYSKQIHIQTLVDSAKILIQIYSDICLYNFEYEYLQKLGFVQKKVINVTLWTKFTRFTKIMISTWITRSTILVRLPTITRFTILNWIIWFAKITQLTKNIHQIHHNYEIYRYHCTSIVMANFRVLCICNQFFCLTFSPQ